MTGNNYYDACRMFKHACAFTGCAIFCEHEPWDIEHRLPNYLVADIVNSAFACEVFIKSLLIYHGMAIEKLSGHQLRDLWKKLQRIDPDICETTKQRIQSEFNSDNNEEFYERINNISNAFAYWRYIYEKHGGKIYISFLRLFRDTLREVCCEKYYKMTWNEFTKGEGEDNEIG